MVQVRRSSSHAKETLRYVPRALVLHVASNCNHQRPTAAAILMYRTYGAPGWQLAAHAPLVPDEPHFTTKLLTL